jgi:hypothetical protein
MMKRIIAEIATVPFSDASRIRHDERAVGHREDDRRERADRGRFGRRSPAGRHRADDDGEDRDQRQHVEQERLEAREAGMANERRVRRQRRLHPDADDDPGDEASASTRPGTTPPISSFEIEMPRAIRAGL